MADDECWEIHLRMFDFSSVIRDSSSVISVPGKPGQGNGFAQTLPELTQARKSARHTESRRIVSGAQSLSFGVSRPLFKGLAAVWPSSLVGLPTIKSGSNSSALATSRAKS